MSEPVTIANGDLSAVIFPLGAELQSLRDSAGREYMTDADPAYWTGHAPLLFPIVGRLAGDWLSIDGCDYPMKQHGFARLMEWEVVGAGADAATFRLRDAEATRAAFPFAFEVAVLYALDGPTLSTVVRVGNPGAVPLPFSFGFHPAFAWPLPEGGEKLGHRIEFERDEPAPIRRLDGNGLLAFSEASPVDGRNLPLGPGLFEANAMIWDRLASRKLVYRSPSGPRLEIAFPGMPYLGIWQKPGANFICIEPWAGHADPAGFDGDFRDKPGVVLLEPGAERSFAMDVTVIPG